MSVEERDGLVAGLRGRVLDDARSVAEKSLERLRELAPQLPTGVVDQLERLHADPGERRKSARLGDGSIAVAVRLDAGEDSAEVRDRGSTGLAVVLPCPAGVGSVLRVLMPPALGGGGWVTVEVRHCRREGDGWVAGCEVVADVYSR